MNEEINSPTLYQIITLDEAYDLLNKTFFEGKLRSLIINQQHKKSPGYFLPNRWKAKKGISVMHEINLSPFLMSGDNKMIISTLLRYMVSHWQYCFGEPPSKGYYNKQWADKMIAVGLQPAAVDDHNKMTGRSVTHSIIKDGPFDTLISESSFQIRYCSVATEAVNKKKNKVKYSCPSCGNQVWGRAGLNLTCNDCERPYTEDNKEANDRNTDFTSYDVKNRIAPYDVN